MAIGFAAGCSRGTPALPSPTPTPTPPGQASLSLFEPAGADCAWLRIDPVEGDREVVATIPGACGALRMIWNTGGSYALIDHTKMWLWRGGALQMLPDLPVGTPYGLGFEGDGTAVALTEDAPAGETWDKLKKISGRPVEDCKPVVKRYFTVRGGEWLEQDRDFFGCGDVSAEAARRFSAYRLVRPYVWEVDVLDASDPVKDPQLQRTLDAAFTTSGRISFGNNWRRLPTVGGLDLAVTQQSVLFLKEGKAKRPPDLPMPNMPSQNALRRRSALPRYEVTVRGRWILVTGRGARLYDSSTGQPVFASDTCTAVTFWPRPPIRAVEALPGGGARP